MNLKTNSYFYLYYICTQSSDHKVRMQEAVLKTLVTSLVSLASENTTAKILNPNEVSLCYKNRSYHAFMLIVAANLIFPISFLIPNMCYIAGGSYWVHRI